MSNPLVEIMPGFYAARGHAAYDPVKERWDFIAAEDGPLLRLFGSGDQKLIMTFEAAQRLAEILPKMLETPVCAPGANDDAIRANGLEPVPA